MTAIDWRLADRLIIILHRDIGRTDDELTKMLGCDHKTLSRMVGVLWRQGKVDRCWRWLVLGPKETSR